MGVLRGSDRWIVYSGCSQRLEQMDRVQWVLSEARTDGSCIVGALRGSDRWIVYSGCSQGLGQMDRV